ncbi:junctional sarcoplasmic reticulum protein 1 [Xiphias gladius]|uniref:junctional sarcoplasmic reticulum protein 1 n=1 Tax=Xiphias gladius TaxID=8245 RepID=UPI001A982ED7|nr:junctional sarcoplasmic reticulum protein 1 [Xiphias gladius]
MAVQRHFSSNLMEFERIYQEERDKLPKSSFAALNPVVMSTPVLGCQTVQSMTLLPSQQRNNGHCDKGSPTLSSGPQMWRQEVAPVSQQPRAEPNTLPREPSFPRTTSLHKTLSIQNLTQIETPWENVTLNRCLFVAITILVLTSGFQRLHETLRGRGTVEEEEEVRLTVRHSGILRHKGQLPEPETSLWEVMFWWLPDLDDEEDEDEENDNGEVKRGRSKKGAMARTSRGLRNKPLLDKKLMKQRDGKLKDRRAKKARDKETEDKKERDKKEDFEEAAGEDEDEGDGETASKKNKRFEEKKEKKKP